jgi:hypothetical protein
VGTNQPPNWSPTPRKLSGRFLISLRTWLDHKLSQGHVIPSSAMHYCLPMSVPKEDGTDRIVIDYIPLNKITPPVTFYPPNMLSMLQTASSGYYFSKVDIVDAYAQLAIHPDDWHYFAFHTPWGIFTFTRLSQGWCAAPAHWQHFISQLLRQYWQVCLFAYHDDILLFTKTQQEHYVKLRQIKSLLSRAGLAVHDLKSKYVQTSIKILGTNLSHGRVSPIIPWETIQQWKVPSNVHQLRRFLGTIGAFRDHIPSLSQLTRDLDKLTGNTPWHWDATHSHSFHMIKRAAVNAVALAPHRVGVPQKLVVDASDRGLGALLEENQHIIAVISRRLTSAESGYDTKERELLAIHWAIEKLFHFTHDATNILVHTDHANLVTSLKGTASRGRVNRSLEWLSNFPLTWTHIPGRLNPADGPSRLYD